MVIWSTLFSNPNRDNYRYAVVIKTEAYQDPAWQEVADSLLKIHDGFMSKLFKWDGTIAEIKNELSLFRPDYIGVIGRPVTDVTSDFVHSVHQLCRDLDEDIYADAVYGIITGYEAADALRAIQDSVIVKTAIIAHQGQDFSGFHDPSGFPGYRHFYQTVYTSEGGNDYPATQYNFADGTVFKENKALDNQPDRVITYSNWLNSDSIKISVPGQGEIAGTFDLFSTSGHGNINSWQAQFPSPQVEGFIRSEAGTLYGDPQSGDDITITVKTPKLYLATGNCLIGQPDDVDNMVYAWFHTGRAVNMFGYIVTSGYGYMGWGNYERFVHFPGLYSAAECYFITNQSLLMDINNTTPGVDISQLEHYKDNTILYGDPKAVAYSMSFGDSACIYLQDLKRIQAPDSAIPDTFIYTVSPHHHDLDGGNSFKSFYHAYRPFQFLPARIDQKSVAIEQNDGHVAVITDNFVLWDLLHTNEKIAKGDVKTLRWTAKVTEDMTAVQLFTKKKCSSNKARLKVFPSSDAHSLVIHYVGGISDNITVSLYSAMGKRLLCETVYNSARPLKNKFLLSLKNEGNNILGNGVYWVVVNDGTVTSIRKIIALLR